MTLLRTSAIARRPAAARSDGRGQVTGPTQRSFDDAKRRLRRAEDLLGREGEHVPSQELGFVALASVLLERHRIEEVVLDAVALEEQLRDGVAEVGPHHEGVTVMHLDLLLEAVIAPALLEEEQQGLLEHALRDLDTRAPEDQLREGTGTVPSPLVVTEPAAQDVVPRENVAPHEAQHRLLVPRVRDAHPEVGDQAFSGRDGGLHPRPSAG